MKKNEYILNCYYLQYSVKKTSKIKKLIYNLFIFGKMKKIK